MRELLIHQQRDAGVDLPLPLLLRTPTVVLLWVFAVASAVGALALGRISVPRVVRGDVVGVGAGSDSLTPVLLLPRSARAHISSGQIVAVDTGDGAPLMLAIRFDSATAASDSFVRQHAPRSRVGFAADTALMAVPLERCRGNRCLALSVGRHYSATAALGTRSLASFALPRS